MTALCTVATKQVKHGKVVGKHSKDKVLLQSYNM